MSLTLQVSESPQQFLEAIGNVDNVSTNLAVGAAHDASQRADPQQKSVWMILYGQYTDGDQTIHISYDSSLTTGQLPIWVICCSNNLETYYITWSKKDARILSIASSIAETIVKALITIKVPPVHSVMGPKLLSDPFLAAWGSSEDPPLTIREQAFFTTRLAYVTSSEWAEIQKTRQDGIQNEVLDVTTLQYDRDSPETQNVRNQLVQCVLEFWGMISEEGNGAAEKLVDELLDKHEPGRLWICRATDNEGETIHNEITGYLYMGRETKTTIALRNLYIKTPFRGRGVAKDLVAAACGWWLLEADGDKKKQAVTLFVEPENPAAMRTYLRSGFRIEEEPWERRGFNGVSMGSF